MSLRRIPLFLAAFAAVALTFNACGEDTGGAGGTWYPPVGGSGGKGGTGGTAGSGGTGGDGGTAGSGGTAEGGSGGGDAGSGGTGSAGSGGGGAGGSGGQVPGVHDLHVTGADLATIGGSPTGAADAWIALTNLRTGVREGLDSRPLQDGSFDVVLSGALGAGERYRVDLLVDLTPGEGICDEQTDFLFTRSIGPVDADVEVAFLGSETPASGTACRDAFPAPPAELDLRVDASGFGSSAVPVHAKLIDVSSGGDVVGTADTTVDAATGTFHLLFPAVLSRSANYEIDVWVDEDASGTCEANEAATEVRVQGLAWPDRTCEEAGDCEAGMTCVKERPEQPEGTCGPLPNPIVLHMDAATAGRAGCARFP